MQRRALATYVLYVLALGASVGVGACGAFGTGASPDPGATPPEPEPEGGADGAVAADAAGAADATADAATAVDAADAASAACNGAADCERYVFVTSAQFIGAMLGGTSGGDAKCKLAADASTKAVLHGRT